jgi:hypothetical protein
MAIPISYVGRGTQLLYSLDGSTYVGLTQLRQFESSGSKQTLVDQTNLRQSDSFTYPLPVLIDSGEIDFAGALNPQDPTYLALEQFHGGLTLVFWKVIFVDGSSVTFKAFVSEFKPFGVAWNKILNWSGKLRLAGGFTGVSGGFGGIFGLATAAIFVATTVASSPAPAFQMLGNVQLFQITLSNDVSAPTLLTAGMVVPALIVFEITQDATGGRNFAWPANVFGGAFVNPGANETTSQLFYFDGTNALALSDGTVTP